MDVVISIKPEFVKEIEKHVKKFEYRKSKMKQEVGRVYIYATMPIGKIVGYFDYNGCLVGTPEAIWKETHEYAGISKEFFDEYFEGRRHAHAIKISKYISFKEPIDPMEVVPGFMAPQGYIYADRTKDQWKGLFQRAEQERRSAQ